jgi:hypothetical protein
MDTVINERAGVLLLAILIIGGVLAVMIWLYVLVGQAAHKRGRSSAGWILFAIVFSPLLAWIALLVLGETDVCRLRRIEDEEYHRARARARYSIDLREEERCNPSAETIDDRYRDRYTPIG